MKHSFDLAEEKTKIKALDAGADHWLTKPFGYSMGKTRIQVILVPYDSGNRSLRMGAGPEHFVKNGLEQTLTSDGYEVFVETIEPRTKFQAEIKTQFELYKLAAVRVLEATRA